MIVRLLPLAIAVVMIGGCATWVKQEPGAEDIRLVDPQHVTACKRVGKTTTSVRERVSAYQRKPGRVEEELAILARNSALELGGDTIVADGPVEDGQRRFVVYRCRD